MTFQKSLAERPLSTIAVIQNSKSHQFEGQLTADTVEKLRITMIRKFKGIF